MELLSRGSLLACASDVRQGLPRCRSLVWVGDTEVAVTFFEVLWHGEGIGDGADFEEALASYVAVRPEEGTWHEACAESGASPCIKRYASFDAYLDNANELETIPVTAAMIEAALDQLP